MIRVTFRTRQEQLTGFRITGHAGAGTAGEDIVCAAVSSAAYMTVNTLTDVLDLPAAITVEDGLMDVTVTGDATAAQALLSGFRLHMTALQETYPQRVRPINTEV